MSTGIGVSSDGQQSNSNKAPRLKPTEALTDISRWVEVQDLPEVLEKSEGFLSDGLVKGCVVGRPRTSDVRSRASRERRR